MKLLELLHFVYVLSGCILNNQAQNDPFGRGKLSAKNRGDMFESSKQRNPFSRLDNKEQQPILEEAHISNDTDNVKIQRKRIKIAIILPQDTLNMRNLRGCITREMNKINSGNWNFLKHFFLDSYTYVIYKTYKDIIDTICSLLQSHSNTAIYINYSDNSKLDELNSRLFLRFANLINLPVMSYLPNAYITVRWISIKKR